MKTDAEVRNKLAWLNDQRGNITDLGQRRELDTDIARLNWVLDEGPDVIIVPKPSPSVSRSQE